MTDFNIQVKVDPTQAARGARRVQESLNGVSKSADNVTRMLKRTFGSLAVGAGLVAAVRTLANFSQEMSTVRAITQASGEEFKSMRDVAKELGATTRFSATQAAEGMSFLARAGFNTNQVMASIGDTLKLAQAGALDLGRAADIASNILTGFRIPVDEAGRVVDVLALAANSANTNISQLGEGMKFVAPVAAGMNVSLEEATAAVAALSDAGLQASLAGTGLRRILSELESPAAKSKKILSELGLTAKDVKVSQVGLTNALIKLRDAGIDTGLALELFGDRGGPAFEVLSTSIPKVQEFNDAFKKAEGTVDSMAAIMDDNLNGALLAVKSAVEALIISFGDLGGDSTLTVLFRGLAKLIRSMAANLGQLISILGTATAAWAAYFLSIKLQTMSAAIASTVKHFAAIASGQPVINAAIAAEQRKARAITSGIAVELAATKATIRRMQVELSMSGVMKSSTAAQLARAATLNKITKLEKIAVTQSTALRAAVTAQGAAAAKSTGIFAKLGALFPGLTAAARSFSAALSANPIGVVVLAVTTIIGLLYTFRNSLHLTGNSMATLADLAAVAWESIKLGLLALGDILVPVFGKIKNAAEWAFGSIDISVAGILRFGAKIIDRYLGLWIGLFNAIIEVWQRFPSAMKEIGILAINGLVETIEKGTNQIIGVLNNLLSIVGISSKAAQAEFSRFENDVAGATKNLGVATKEAFLEGFNLDTAQSTVDDILQKAEERAYDRTSLQAYTPAPGDNIPDTGAAEAVANNNLGDNRLMENEALEQQKKILKELNGPLDDYRQRQEAVNALLAQGAISQEQYNIAMNNSQLSQNLQGVEQAITTDQSGFELDRLQEQLNERMEILRQSREAELISEQEFLMLKTEAYRKHAQEIASIEEARNRVALQAASSTFGSLANIAGAYQGKQSKAYRAMFAVSKAFAIAESAVQIGGALAKAANNAYPLNLVAMATVAQQTASIVSNIQAVQFAGGYATGGEFKVGGAGNTDSQLVAFRASPNETVSVRTPSQQNSQNNMQSAPQEPPKVNVVNFTDPNLLEDYMTTAEGERTFLNIVQRNGRQIKNMIEE